MSRCGRCKKKLPKKEAYMNWLNDDESESENYCIPCYDWLCEHSEEIEASKSEMDDS